MVSHMGAVLLAAEFLRVWASLWIVGRGLSMVILSVSFGIDADGHGFEIEDRP